MDPLQPECFYRIVARFPRELADPSPLKSHEQPLLIGSPKPEEIYRVSEDADCYIGDDIAKPRGCFLANYDPISKIGIIFLTTTREQAYPWRYMRVHGGQETPFPDSLFISKLTFLEPCWINVSHPLRVKVMYVEPHSSSKGTLRRAHVDPNLTPPIVGVQYGKYHANVNPNSIRFCSESRERFWKAHVAYHARRNCVRTVIPSGLQTLHEEGGGGAGGSDDGAGSGRSPREEERSLNKEISDVGITDRQGQVGNTFYAQGQSYGLVNGKEIGVDVPLMLASFSDESEDELILDESGQIFDGVYVITDLSGTITDQSGAITDRSITYAISEIFLSDGKLEQSYGAEPSST